MFVCVHMYKCVCSFVHTYMYACVYVLLETKPSISFILICVFVQAAGG